MKHDEHLRLYITKGKTTYDSSGMSISDMSYITLDKTKLSPKMVDIPLIFDITKGGRIAERLSFLRYFYDKNYLTNAGGWYKLDGIVLAIDEAIQKNDPSKNITSLEYYAYFYDKYLQAKYRYSGLEELVESDDVFYLILRLLFIDMIGSTYSLQKEVMSPYRSELLVELGNILDSTIVTQSEESVDTDQAIEQEITDIHEA